MRTEVESILGGKGHEFFSLPLAARLLLVTDGTVTELLEAMVREPLALGYREQGIDRTANHPAILNKTRTDECLHRIITLRGCETGIDWLYAESVILHELLSMDAQSMLIEEKLPIGIILDDQTSDNHRRIVDCGISPYAVAANHLNLDPMYAFTYRVYQIMVGDDLIMSISEWFPIDRISDKISSTY
jgi:chorismate-pyruvate lyase